jgi:carboxyl-terminal processing protease
MFKQASLLSITHPECLPFLIHSTFYMPGSPSLTNILNRCAIHAPLHPLYDLILPFLTGLICLGSCTQTNAQTIALPAYGKQSNALVKLMERYHYQPVQFNKQFSGKIYLKFIHELDPRGLYFTLEDFASFSEYSTRLDDEVSNCSHYFLDLVTQKYHQKLIATDTLVGQLLRQPTDFTVTDTIFYTKSDTVTYPTDAKALQRRWRRYLKYEILVDLYSPDDSDKVNPFGMDVKEVLKKEPEVRARLLKRTQRKINRLLQHGEGFENYVASEYFNAITTSYDPHSEFFSDQGKDDFVSMLSADEFSFGISFEENENGDPEISHLIPGGAAWKSNQLNDGDILLKIKSTGSSPHDFPFVSLNQVEDILRSKANKNLELTVRKPNGQLRNVPLEKSRIQSDENAIKSYLLTGDKKIGYISLPSFYTEWGTSSPLGCANDVAKEIIKLQEEHIDGLILDLRYNGGGSVYEAIELAGIFIDEGPISIFKERNLKPLLLKDVNRGTAYDGPLVVMVNGMSASASELFAGGIQDYNRGLIVGCDTYGKASGQTIFPVDSIYSFPELFSTTCMPTKSERKKMGFAKITIEKFYNLHNGTHQKRGIHPDVPLPDPFYFNEYKESSLSSVLSNDSVIKKVVYHPLSALPVTELAAASRERLVRNKSFIRFNQLNDSLRMIQKEERKLILKPENFKKEEKKSYQLASAMDKLHADSTGAYQVKNNAYEQQIIEMDNYSLDTNKILLRSIQKDIFIEESYQILRDLIILNKK